MMKKLLCILLLVMPLLHLQAEDKTTAIKLYGIDLHGTAEDVRIGLRQTLRAQERLTEFDIAAKGRAYLIWHKRNAIKRMKLVCSFLEMTKPCEFYFYADNDLSRIEKVEVYSAPYKAKDGVVTGKKDLQTVLLAFTKRYGKPSEQQEKQSNVTVVKYEWKIGKDMIVLSSREFSNSMDFDIHYTIVPYEPKLENVNVSDL